MPRNGLCTFFTGNADGTFQGDNFLNRAEIAAIGARAEYTDAEIAQLSADRDIPFPDLLRQEWFTGSAIMSQSLGFIDGLGENHPTMPGYFDAAGNLDVLQAMKLFITIPARHYPEIMSTYQRYANDPTLQWFQAWYLTYLDIVGLEPPVVIPGIETTPLDMESFVRVYQQNPYIDRKDFALGLYRVYMALDPALAEN